MNEYPSPLRKTRKACGVLLCCIKMVEVKTDLRYPSAKCGAKMSAVAHFCVRVGCASSI